MRFIRLRQSKKITVNDIYFIINYCITNIYLYFLSLKEEEESACSDGTFTKERYFTCPAGRGFFVLLEHCRPDSRFANSPTTDVSLTAGKGKQARLNNTNEMCTAKKKKNPGLCF